jgi:hypothetical protein
MATDALTASTLEGLLIAWLQCPSLASILPRRAAHPAGHGRATKDCPARKPAEGFNNAILRELSGQKLGIRALFGHSCRAVWNYVSYRLQKGNEASAPWVRHYTRLAYEARFLEYLFSADRLKTWH